MISAGPACTSSDSMQVWSQLNVPTGFRVHTPGITNPGTKTEPYEGKKGQAEQAAVVYKDPIPDIIVGYSAGAVGAIYCAQ